MTEQPEDSGPDYDPDWDEKVAALPASLTTREAAYVLRMHATTVTRLARQDELPGAVRVGGKGKRGEWRFSKQRLLQLLQIEDADLLGEGAESGVDYSPGSPQD